MSRRTDEWEQSDEKVRTFVLRRPWLSGKGRTITSNEYDDLKHRRAFPVRGRITYLLAFMDGYLNARPSVEQVREARKEALEKWGTGRPKEEL